jgi:hypothetical protein
LRACVAGDISSTRTDEVQKVLIALQIIHAPGAPVPGLIYAVTSELIAAVKVGYWTGRVHDLYNRYRGAYGPHLEIVYEHCVDAKAAEKMMLFKLRACTVYSELMRKDRYDDIVACLTIVASLFQD